LGKTYPGYFPVGDTAELTRLLLKAECDGAFYRALKRCCARVSVLVRPRREIASWKLLLRELQPNRSNHRITSAAPRESTF